MASSYNRYSRYKSTTQTWYLGYNEPTSIAPSDDDEILTLPAKYNENPAKLAYDRYNNERLYYVFALANIDIIIDPIYDFVTGITIRVPTNARIQKMLGGNF